MNPILLPLPRKLSWGAASTRIPADLPLVLASFQQELLPTALRFKEFARRSLGVGITLVASLTGTEGDMAIEVVADQSVSHPQGYRLQADGGRIRIAASSAQGAAYGLTTLKQMLAGSGRRLSAVEIEDFPDFERRGVMLDISRGKVPTMESLFALVDQMADLKINEFQLYTEHTFGYRKHREAWQFYSPMTGEEILILDRYCRERFIDLVPNQNSFGHLKEWLIHDRYKHMAEVTDGWTFGGIWREGPFSLTPVEPSVPSFLARLYDELLPHFSSPYFNVGCDETFDLGQGQAREAVETQGEHRVYLGLLLKIYEMVKARGRTMQFWGDIIIKAPEYIPELPKDVVALEWGYEAEHPFDVNCGHFAAASIPFYVCPGTSTWNTIVGRTDNAIGNIRSAAENGKKHGAIGFLNTIWGDRGHQDYQPVSYLGISYGAAVSWAVDANRAVDVRPALDRFFFGDQAGLIGQVLYDLGNVYQAVGVTLRNASVLGAVLHQGFEASRALAGVTPEGLDRAAAAVRAIAVRIDQLHLTCADGPLVLRELANSVRMLLHAAELGKLKLRLAAGEKPSDAEVRTLAEDLDRIMAEHRELWLARNRVGGLEEMSLAPLRRIRAGYDRLRAGEQV